MWTLTVNVTQEDIDKGVGQSPSHCPIARAATREVGLQARAGSLILTFVNLSTVFYLGKEARSFVRQFDSGRDLAPIALESTLSP